ncbi:MAG: glutathione S-transferase family protein [Gammaproteobacteria bacterium]
MYKLYWSDNTGALAPQVALEEAGAAYERIIIDTDKGEHRKPEFLAINPRAQIPALALPDGSVMTESAAMMLHIADCHPQAGLLPAPGDPARAQAYRWLLFFSVHLYESDLRYYYPDRYTADPTCAQAVKDAGLRELDRGFDIVEQEINGPYVLGERFSAADIYLLMLVQWHPQPAVVLARCPTIAALCDRARARPTVQRIWPQHYQEATA